METERLDGRHHTARVAERRLYEHIKIGCEPRPAVSGDRVRADDQIPDAVSVQQLQERDPVLVKLGHAPLAKTHAVPTQRPGEHGKTVGAKSEPARRFDRETGQSELLSCCISLWDQFEEVTGMAVRGAA